MGADADVNGDGGAQARVILRKVECAMGQLPDDQREVVALVLVEGLSYKEAADVLDIPMSTLTSRLVRGRQALMTELGGSRMTPECAITPEMLMA